MFVAASPRGCHGCDRVALSLSSDASVVPVLAHSLERAALMLGAGAFVHQYARFGVDPSALARALDALHALVRGYAAMVTTVDSYTVA